MNPSIAAGNGLHQHDDTLEDFSAAGVAGQIATWRQLRTSLQAIPLEGLTPDERVDHRIMAGLIDGWLLDLETVKSWQKNLMVYASAVSSGVHNLMTMESSPADVRARRIIAKVAGVPALLAAADANLTDPPRVMAERGVRMFRGAAGMLRADVPLAFAGLEDAALKTSLVAATASRRHGDRRLCRALRARAAAQGGRRLRGGPRDARGALPGRGAHRPAGAAAAGHRRTRAGAGRARLHRGGGAGSTRSRHALAVCGNGCCRTIRRAAPLVPAAQQAVNALQAFVTSKGLVSLPSSEPVVVAAAPPYDLGLASMHSSPPLETTPVKSYFYITDAQADWDAARQDAWLQKFNIPTLTVITAHEVMPGHYVHSLFMRKTPGKIRRIWIGLNPFPQPSSGQDGWAHYAEQLVLDEGFMADDPRYRMAQLSEAMTRICRLIAGIQLHTGAWSVDDAAKLFELRAHLPPPAARQEAERGTYDPTYGGYFLGKLQALKLRDDVRAKEGAAFDLRRFHERVMTNGIAPWWAHRQLLLPGDTAPAAAVGQLLRAAWRRAAWRQSCPEGRAKALPYVDDSIVRRAAL